MITLPTSIKKAEIQQPKTMLCLGEPKIGKTNLMLNLPNSLLIDMEYDKPYYDGVQLNIGNKPAEELVEDFVLIQNLLNKQYKEFGKTDYDYIVLDNASVLDVILPYLALRKLKREFAVNPNTHSLLNANLLKNNGINISQLSITDYNSLPFGGNAKYDLLMFEFILQSFSKFANKTLIILGHPKMKDVNVTDLNVSNLDMTGKRSAQLFKMVDVALLLTIKMENIGGIKQSNMYSKLLESKDGSNTTRFDYYLKKLHLNNFILDKNGDIVEKNYYPQNLFPN